MKTESVKQRSVIASNKFKKTVQEYFVGKYARDIMYILNMCRTCLKGISSKHNSLSLSILDKFKA
jgi:hypothetical protein